MGKGRAVVALTVLCAAAACVADERDARKHVVRCDDSRLLKLADARRVDVALRTPDAAWTFLTAPGTSYADRLAVIQRLTLPAAYLPRVVAALRELYRERSLHAWGLKPDPHDSGYLYDRSVPEGGTTRIVLGHPFAVLPRRVDYPLTCDEESHAPWPWQVTNVLVGAQFSIARAPAAEYDLALLMLPCATDDELSGVRQALAIRRKVGRDAATPVFMAVWRNVTARDRGLYGGRAEYERFAAKHSGVVAAEAIELCASSSKP